MGSLIRATNLLGFSDLVRELGGEPDRLLQRYGIQPGIEYVEDAFVSYAALAWLIAQTADELDCPDFGLRLSAWQGIDILGPVAVIARNSDTVLDAFVAIGRYLHLHSPALHLTVAGPDDPGFRSGSVTFHFSIEERGLPYLPQSYELSLANGYRIGRLLGGDDMRPRAVAFQHERIGPQRAYEETFNGPVLFGQDRSGFEIDDRFAERPVDRADPETRRIVARYLDTSFGEGEELAPHVSILVRRLLPTGTCSADAVARNLGVHARTMQRHLAREGTSFAAILDQERKARAAQLLGNPGFQLGQIAGILGYTEQSTFNRSFRRWYGMTPRAFRQARAV
ncbi:MAG TPA: AraC family transcriptional regulator [Aeromicrobium sp.]|nr:AraC family transcriptional regulator [Aeromicrobium sp.]